MVIRGDDQGLGLTPHGGHNRIVCLGSARTPKYVALPPCAMNIRHLNSGAALATTGAAPTLSQKEGSRVEVRRYGGERRRRPVSRCAGRGSLLGSLKHRVAPAGSRRRAALFVVALLILGAIAIWGETP